MRCGACIAAVLLGAIVTVSVFAVTSQRITKKILLQVDRAVHCALTVKRGNSWGTVILRGEFEVGSAQYQHSHELEKILQ